MTNAVIFRSLAWSKRPMNAAVQFALKGPSWMSIHLRRVPLRILARTVEVQVLVMLKFNGVSGS